VTAKYNRANGYEADCDVIYGDTDSVMVNFKVLAPDEVLQAHARQPCSPAQPGSCCEQLLDTCICEACSICQPTPWRAAV
jgi:DNA polymerase family B